MLEAAGRARTSSPWLLGLLGAVALVAGVRPAAAAADPAFLRQYCVSCHSERLKTGGLSLEKANPGEAEQNPDVWEKVLRKLRTRMMPPAGVPHPNEPELTGFVAALETTLDGAAKASPNPGRPAVHRLNRSEYGNAVRDLLGLEIDVTGLLPADDQAHGFDNNADVLSVSPTLMERYLTAATRVSRAAVGSREVRPAIETYRVSPSELQETRTSDDLPFGTRGGVAVRHYFPLDGEYEVRVRLHRNYVGYVKGVRRKHTLEVRLDRALVGTLAMGGEDHGRPAPASFAGEIFGEESWEGYAHRADEHLNLRFRAKAGWRVIAVAFLKVDALTEGALQPVDRSSFNYGVDEAQYGLPAVASVGIGGPYKAVASGDTPSRRRIFTCRPTATTPVAERTCATKIFETLARRGYRRPVKPGDVSTLLGFFETGRADGGFEAGIQAGLERLLTDPEFLFRIERDPAGIAPGTPYRLSDIELASRLSFFLWSSLPDDALLDAAAKGRLKDSAILDQQVRRMLADRRSTALVSKFFGKWLHLEAIETAQPDVAKYPNFSDVLRTAMKRETQLFLEYQLREDRSILDLVQANYSFLNEDLARHYGIRGVYGPHFRRVTLPGDERRGLLGQASLLTVTSYANRTSPVRRGVWLLENFVGARAPIPPANVPALEDEGADGKPSSVRDRLEKHRKNPVCASCHRVIDPLGFALENFDPTGRWRTENEPRSPFQKVRVTIDTTGTLPDGSKLDGPAALRELFVRRKDEFVSVVAEKMLTYALGRGTDAEDMPAVRAIVRQAAGGGYTWSALVKGIATSVPFQMRRSAS